nr:2-dehydropantoate 2-reductase [Gluconacetobacter azotocaptans]
MLARALAASGGRSLMPGLKICVAGVGAMGGMLAGMLARTDVDLSLVARGETLRTLREKGLTVHDGQSARIVRCAANTRAPDTVQDVVILAAKSQQLPALAACVSHAVGPQTLVVPVVNGLPWWMTLPTGSPCGAARACVDPGGELARAFPPARVVGCVAYAFASLDAPAVVRSAKAPTLVLGRVQGGNADDPEVAALVQVLDAAGVVITRSPDIRCDVWAKLAVNLATNPLSVVCEETLGGLVAAPPTRQVVRDMLEEAVTIGRACGFGPLRSVDEQLGSIAVADGHRTSMLQDYQAGRALELDAIGYAVMRVGAVCGVAMPVTATILRLADFKAARPDRQGNR